MVVTLREFWQDPWFRAGLALRLGLIVLLVPWLHGAWYIPFLENGLAGGLVTPWADHLAAGGDPLAFPYGPVMYLAFLPGVLVGGLLDGLIGASLMTSLAFGLSVLVYDLLLALAIRSLLDAETRSITLLYWFSPLVLYLCYWHGQLDVVPVLLLTAALWLLKELRFAGSAALLGLAVAAKLSVVPAAGVILVYLLTSKRLRHALPLYAAVLIAVTLAANPWLLSEAARLMILGNREMAKLTRLSIELGGNREVYLIPLLYALILFWVWQLRRLNFDLLMAVIAICFFLIVTLSASPVNWYLWLLPFLIAHQLTRRSPTAGVMILGLSLVVVATGLMTGSGPALPLLGLDLSEALGNGRLAPLLPYWYSGLTALNLIIAWRLYRDGVQRDEYFRLSRRPLTVGIAGDSGAGKDTLADNIAGLFEPNSVTKISGDDFHLWDRTAPMWRVLTHLNPRSNDLSGLTNTVLAVLDGRRVQQRAYDHSSGRFAKSQLMRQNEVILVTGLHALYPEPLRGVLDNAIFLEMDEDLRRHFKLRRDVKERGHSADQVLNHIESRMEDRARFVDGQRDKADLVFTLEPVNPAVLGDPTQRDAEPPRVQLRAQLRGSARTMELVEVLVSLCGLRVDSELRSPGGAVEILVEGEVFAEDIAMAVHRLAPNMEELLALQPRWRDGMAGVMQLIFLLRVDEGLRMRR